MNKSLRPVWGIFLVLCGVVAIALFAKSMRAEEIVPWRTDFVAASEESRRDNKPLMAYFTATWCAPCQGLKHTTWADKDVEAALRGYVPVKVDIDREPELVREYGINAVPAFAVVEPDGTKRRSAVGALPPGDFLDWLKS